ncbi:hypothetical protein [Streptomyces sp. CSDS2]|uniref:hypothetical protein n=1 Tax=Streptomyces sp. CSDS2 TaxID=3055051 RepID=UPI00339D3B3E
MLAAHGGPLPEPVVRALGAALAGALASAHARGVTHAGVSPAAVLLGVDGPLLACFGAVRAVAPDGERRPGSPALDPGCLDVADGPDGGSLYEDSDSMLNKTTWSFRVSKNPDDYWLTADANRVFLVDDGTPTALPVS